MTSAPLILSLCDLTGNWPRSYAEAGYRVTRIELRHGGDVRLFRPPREAVFGILAAPPCTVFANSGARWKRSRRQMLNGLSVVDACLRIVAVCRPTFWALENPCGKLSRYLGEPDSLKERGVVLKGEYAHWFNEWDGLTVDETTPEFESCTCFPDDTYALALRFLEGMARPVPEEEQPAAQPPHKESP